MNEVELQQVRAAENQALFRAVNRRIEELNELFDHLSPHGTWTCECARVECVERVELTLAEYETVREQPTHFFVAPGEAHVFPEAERVVERGDRYWVVEKIGAAAERAADFAVE